MIPRSGFMEVCLADRSGRRELVRRLTVFGVVALGSTILTDPAVAGGRKKRGRKSRAPGGDQDDSEATSDAPVESGEENSANAAAAE